MIELESGKALDINLQEDTHGQDRVVLTMQSLGCELSLTPHQARVLATELIMSVNRAEVRSNLKHSHSLVRSAQPGDHKHRLFSQAFAK
ncbi:MAG: hypothetical protein R6W97_03930 [Thiobacillus sp.]